jgi:hypothetical protein
MSSGNAQKVIRRLSEGNQKANENGSHRVIKEKRFQHPSE